MKFPIWSRRLPIALLIFGLAACNALNPPVAVSPTATASSPTPTVPNPTLPPSPTPLPSATPLPTPFPLPASDTPLVGCDQRKPAADDLLPVVTSRFGLSPDYVPPGLVKLGDYISYKVVNPGFLFRAAAVDALVKLVQAMQADGLHPLILSSYRGYYDQVIVRQNWDKSDPNYAYLISAEPGHSEHQLGTVVDFGSPELPGLVGDPAVQFDPLFAQTSEGLWLADHAAEYGFTMTNPQGAYDWTGLIYEPWHYRYVGTDLATYLQASGNFLTRFLMQARPVLPCIPSLSTP
jgi:D-alanyl-D-alanine carboxypeptidase